MRLHRFIGDFDLRQETIFCHDYEIVHQIRYVLRLTLGDVVLLADGKGSEVQARISNIKKDEIAFNPVAVAVKLSQEFRPVFLFCAIIKKDRFEWIVQKATEIGISHIMPVITKRTVKQKLNMERLDSIAREAAEQSGRTHLPILAYPTPFADAVSVAKQQGRVLFCHQEGKDIFALLPFPKEKIISIFIGPEGGWDSDEVSLAKKNNFLCTSLGPTTLRAETAAVVASYVAVHH